MPRRTAHQQPGGTWAVDIGPTITVYGQTKQSAEDWAADVEYKIQTFGAVVEKLERAERHLTGVYRAMTPQANDGEQNRFADADPVLGDIRTLLARVKKGEEL